MAAFCHQCGVPLRPGAQFCEGCGAAISGAGPVTKQPHVAAQPPPHAAKRNRLTRAFGFVLLLSALIIFIAVVFHAPDTTTAPGSSTAASEADKAVAPLDYSKPVYTTDHAVICPMSLLSDPREDHDINAVMDMYMSPFFMDSKAEKLGCEVWHGGIEVTAKPMGENLPFATVNEVAFTMPAHLTNNADGSTRYVDSNTAQHSSSTSASTTNGESFDPSKTYINTTPASTIPPSNGIGKIMVSVPSNVPILAGDVKAANLHGVGATICPDSRAFAAFVEGIDESNKRTALDSMRHCGCSYFPPDTPMVSKGANEYNSLAVVDVKTPGGAVIEGVTIPSSVVQNRQQPQTANQQVQMQNSSLPTGRPAAPQETSPAPADAVASWTDASTGLMWTKKDDGIDVAWREATDYCRNLQLGGHSDWRLPTIEELESIYDPSINPPGQGSGGHAVPWQVKGELQLSAWGEWSSSQANAQDQAWVFGFGNGKPFSYRFDGSKKPRALCVRSSRE